MRTDLSNVQLRPRQRISDSEKYRLVWAALFAGGSSLLLVYLISSGSFDLLFALGQLLFLAVLILWDPRRGWKLLMLLVSASGLLGRIALYLAGKESPLDFLAFSVEVGTIMLTSRVVLLRKSRNRMDGPSDKAVWWYFVFSSLCMLNVFFAGPAVTIWGWRWVCIPVLLYFAGRKLIRSDAEMRSLFRFFALLLLTFSAYGVYQGTFGMPFFERPWIESLWEWGDSVQMIEGAQFLGGKPRIVSMTWGHSNFMFWAGFLFLLTVFAPRRYFSQSYRWVRILALVATLAYAGVSLERSFIAMVILGSVSGLILLLLNKRKYVLLLGMLVVLSTGILLLTQVDPGSIPWSSETVALRRLAVLTDLSTSHSVRSRLNLIWPRALSMLMSNPLGLGLGAFHYTRIAKQQAYFFSPHNMYLQIGLETGWLGLALFVVVIWRCLSKFNRGLARYRSSLYVATVSSMIAVLAAGMFNFPLEKPLSFVFWFYMGAIVSISQLARESSVSGKI